MDRSTIIPPDDLPDDADLGAVALRLLYEMAETSPEVARKIREHGLLNGFLS